MKSIVKFGASLGVCFLALSGAANALPILDIVGGTPVVLPIGGANGGYNPAPPTAGAVAGQVAINADSPGEGLIIDGDATVKATFLGKEAGYTNQLNFVLGSGNVMTNLVAPGTSITQVLTSVVQGSFLPFKFQNLAAIPAEDLINGSVPSATANLGSIAFRIVTQTENFAVILALLNDFGGPDADWDDMVIEFRAVRAGFADPDVPLPAALPLLAAGLGGLLVLGRMRKRRNGATGGG